MNAPFKDKFDLEQADTIYELPIRQYNKFYQFYLTEHRNMMSRRLHFTGSAIGLYVLSKAIRNKKSKYIPVGIAAGYACAWVGHFIFEKNKPASFKQPLYSFVSDWRMFSDIVRGRLSLIDRKYDKIKS